MVRESLARRWCRAPATPSERALLAVLLAQDGSTTRLLEALFGTPIAVHVIDQQVVPQLPGTLHGELPGERFLRRITSLQSGGYVLLDSLSYIAVDVLPMPVVRELKEGIRPIGHVLSELWTRRLFRDGDTVLLEELWRAVGAPDSRASRSLCICTPDAPCMLLAETFRSGVLVA